MPRYKHPHTQAYKSWLHMIRRCRDKNHDKYVYYGARGITVCERWKNFDNFFADMGERPKGMSLDRIDINGHYEPDNCRWATRMQQMQNRRDTVNLTLNGETKCVAEWARELGLHVTLLHWRLKKGWPIEDVLRKTKYKHRTKTLQGEA